MTIKGGIVKYFLLTTIGRRRYFTVLLYIVRSHLKCNTPKTPSGARISAYCNRRDGYRFALDAVLLAHFVKTGPTERILEIGAGSGVVTILVAALNSYHSVDAVEIQSELAEVCRKNFESNNVPNATVHQADIRKASSLFPRESFDLIYCNPPYRKAGAGRLKSVDSKSDCAP